MVPGLQKVSRLFLPFQHTGGKPRSVGTPSQEPGAGDRSAFRGYKQHKIITSLLSAEPPVGCSAVPPGGDAAGTSQGPAPASEHRHPLHEPQMTSVFKKNPLGNFILKECDVGGKRSGGQPDELRGPLQPLKLLNSLIQSLKPSASVGSILLYIPSIHPRIIIWRYVFN